MTSSPLLHIEHLEDLMFTSGNRGFQTAIAALGEFQAWLRGQATTADFSIKFDGSPAIVFGIHPETNKFFVGTKSVFNKLKPKINYTDDDIARNHGETSELASILRLALEHLRKIVTSGVYQGDLAYTRAMLKRGDSYVEFQPNTIRYRIYNNDPRYRDILASQLGIVIHTKYNDKFQPVSKPKPSDFRKSQDVVILNLVPTRKVSDLPTIDRELQAAMVSWAKSNEEIVLFHGKTLREYVNAKSHTGSRPTADDYYNWANTKVKVKSLLKAIQDRYEHDRAAIDAALTAHWHLREAKTKLIRAAGNPTDLEHFIATMKTKPEGFVAKTKDAIVKFVDREEFARLNRMRFAATEQISHDKPFLFTFIRANPPTAGHEKLLSFFEASNLPHLVVLSASHDDDRNPLPGQEKLAILQKLFPRVHFALATSSMPSFMHFLEHLSKQGIRHLIAYFGSDRVPEMQKKIRAYNGKNYSFDRIEVREVPRSDDDVSATKARQAARAGDFDSFVTMMPKRMPKIMAKQLFDRLRGILIHEEKDNVKDVLPELRELARISNIPLRILARVYARGVAAWSSGHKPGMSRRDLGLGRVQQFIARGEVWHTTDSDLAAQVMKGSFNSTVQESLEAVRAKARETGIPFRLLARVYARGLAAWRTKRTPGTTPHQWGLARVNSFLQKSSNTWGGSDRDLAMKALQYAGAS